MDAKRIETRLRLHIANVALAAVGRKEGDLREAKDALIREVERIAFDARNVTHKHHSGERSMRTRTEAEKEARRIGFRDGGAEFETAVEASIRGWPAWRIAQHFNLQAELIHELGGPVPKARNR